MGPHAIVLAMIAEQVVIPKDSCQTVPVSQGRHALALAPLVVNKRGSTYARTRLSSCVAYRIG
jgi:hypothetical protein